MLLTAVVKATVPFPEIPMAQRFHVNSLTLDQVVDSVPTALSPLRDPYLPAVIDGPFLRVADSLVDKLLVAGLVAALLMSVAVWMLIPVYTIGMWLFGSRRFIARALAMDDLPAPESLLVSDRVQGVIDVLVKPRDRPLRRALAAIHDERGDEPARVAVVYGAAHIPAVVTGLHALGYRHRGAE